MKNRLREKYTQVDNELLNLDSVSLKAKGLYAFLCSKPENWNFSYRWLMSQLKEWEKSIRSALRELVSLEIVLRIPIKKWWDFAGWDWIIHPNKSDLSWLKDPLWKCPFSEVPKTGGSQKGYFISNTKLSKTKLSNTKEEETKTKKLSLTKQKVSSQLRTHKLPTIVSVWTRDHNLIVNEYEENGTFNIKELASVNVLNTYELPWLEKLAVIFLDWCTWNKDKLTWKVNIKARFNKFVISDFQWIIKKKAKWTSIETITDDEFSLLMDQWYFKTSNCEFYKNEVRPTLDTQWLNTFRLMIEFFRNKNVWEKQWKTFREWLVSSGKVIS